jgi:acetolactate synthase-1/2/3 large subunit
VKLPSAADVSGNRPSAAEAIVRLWRDLGVEHIFGLCGDTSLPLYDALQRTGGDLTHVLTRDERSAAYMADAYARLSGKVGVCEGPSGGGATYILPGVVEANESSVPVLAVTTDIATTSRGRFALTELDQEALFRPLTKWNAVPGSGAEVPGAFRDAFTAMTTGRPGATHIGLPFDVQNQPVDEDDVWADVAFGALGSHPVVPPAADVEAAARRLAEAERPLFICGGGVVIAGAESALYALAERLGAIVATSVSGQGVYRRDPSTGPRCRRLQRRHAGNPGRRPRG